MPIQQWSEKIWVVKLSDEPLLSEDLTGLAANLQNNGVMPDLVLDMAGVSYFNSSNLSQLLRLRKLALDRGARLRIAAVPDGLWVVFLNTGLDKILDFDQDVANALAGLQIAPGR